MNIIAKDAISCNQEFPFVGQTRLNFLYGRKSWEGWKKCAEESQTASLSFDWMVLSYID